MYDEYEKLRGVRQGNNQSTSPLDKSKSQEEIAENLDMGLSEYHRYKKITTLIPEIQDLVDDRIASSVASRVIARLSDEAA